MEQANPYVKLTQLLSNVENKSVADQDTGWIKATQGGAIPNRVNLGGVHTRAPQAPFLDLRKTPECGQGSQATLCSPSWRNSLQCNKPEVSNQEEPPLSVTAPIFHRQQLSQRFQGASPTSHWVSKRNKTCSKSIPGGLILRGPPGRLPSMRTHSTSQALTPQGAS